MISKKLFPVLKRDARLFLRCLVPALVLTVVFAAVSFAAAMTAARGAESVYSPVKAAVVDKEDSILSRMLVRVVAELDYISQVMDVVSCGSEDEAMALLDSGECAAVIVLPENYIGQITTGEHSRGSIILSPQAASHSELVEACARFGELMLAAGQYGIFSGEELIYIFELGSQFHSGFLSQVNTGLLREAMEANSKYFSVELASYAGTGMSSAAYYALCWLSLVVFICSMFFEKLCRSDMNRPMLCRLKAAGVGDTAFVFGKILYPFLFRVLLLLAAVMILAGLIDMELSFPALLSAAAALLLASVVGYALMMCSERGGALTAVLALIGIFLCGGMVPRQMLPEPVLTVGALTPFGAVLELMGPLFGGNISRAGLALSFAYALAALWLLRRKLRAVRVKGGEV